MNKNPILIMGMHRSGTSCLAGCLEAAGLNLGAVNTFAQHNQKGNREHEAIRDIHDHLMAYHGYTWDNPPPRQLNWRPLDETKLERETRPIADQAPWGFKDPRTVFCLKGWNKFFSPRLVATFRHPNAVAKSLMKRADVWGKPMTQDHAIDLWVRYNRELLNITKSSKLPFIRYGSEPDQYLASVRSLADSIGLDGTKAGDFYADNLRHEMVDSDEIPEPAEKTWALLMSRTSEA